VAPVRKSEHGFTLLEVMITLGLLSVGILGLIGMQLATVRGAQNAVETTLATNLASSALDDLSLVDYSTITNTGITGFPRQYDKQGVEVGVSGGDVYFTVNAAYVAAKATYVDVRVTTTWANELKIGATRTITLNGRIRQRGVVL
jgi:prepilin-type N-terminal cleavage/methylation domain-containing protein